MTKLKDKIIELRHNGKTYNQISKDLNCSKSTVSYYCKINKLNFNLGTTKPLTKEEKANLQLIYNELKSVKKVSELTGFASSTILKYVKTLTRKNILSNKSNKVINWRKSVKKKLVDFKGGKCERCGYNKCLSALHFHHLNPFEKDFSISGKTMAFEKLKEEINKCILVCSNCHCEIHEEIILNKNLSENKEG